VYRDPTACMQLQQRVLTEAQSIPGHAHCQLLNFEEFQVAVFLILSCDLNVSFPVRSLRAMYTYDLSVVVLSMHIAIFCKVSRHCLS